MRTRILLLASCAAALAGCADDLARENNFRRGVVPSSDEFSLQAAQQICSVDSLNTQRSTIIREAREAAFDAPTMMGPDERETVQTETEAREQVNRIYPQRISEKVEILRTFETDLDAAYRFATAACQTYMMCLHQSQYREGSCTEPASQWTTAQARFETISEDVANWRAQLAVQNLIEEPIIIRQEVKPEEAAPQQNTPREPERRPRSCGSATLGDVFTTGPCRG